MKEVFEELLAIAKKDPGSAEKRLAKILEEGGELTASVLKLRGYKDMKSGDSPEALRVNVIEESADLIQVIGSIMVLFDITFDDLVLMLRAKNQKYAAFVIKQLLNTKAPGLGTTQH